MTETKESVNIENINDIYPVGKHINSAKGLSVNDTDDYDTKIVSIREIDFGNDIKHAITEFTKKYKNSNKEYAYVMSPTGLLIELDGWGIRS